MSLEEDVQEFIPLPSTVKIGYQDYQIKLIDPAAVDFCGMTDKHEAVIYLTCKGNSIEQSNTLLHECLHGVVHSQGIQLEDKVEEMIVNSMSNGLTQLLRDNPGLVKFLLDKLGVRV
jgi:hypothetical protein